MRSCSPGDLFMLLGAGRCSRPLRAHLADRKYQSLLRQPAIPNRKVRTAARYEPVYLRMALFKKLAVRQCCAIAPQVAAECLLKNRLTKTCGALEFGRCDQFQFFDHRQSP